MAILHKSKEIMDAPSSPSFCCVGQAAPSLGAAMLHAIDCLTPKDPSTSRKRRERSERSEEAKAAPTPFCFLVVLYEFEANL